MTRNSIAPSDDDSQATEKFDRYAIRRLFTRRGFVACIVIGAILLGTVGAFAYVGGVFSPDRLTQARVVDQFQKTNGIFPGFRRNHSKGVCLTGWFDSNGAGERFSRATVFKSGRTAVFGRFALAGGQPFISDGPMAVHSMALNFTTSGSDTWRTGMNGIPIFSVGTVKDLYDQLAAATPDPQTRKPDPERLKAYFSTHPQAAKARAILQSQPLPSGFANTTYNSLNAFVFRNAEGHATAVRWAMVPEDAFAPAKPDQATDGDKNYQFDDLVQRVERGPVIWHLIVTIAQPGDPTNDATLAWSDNREKIDVGTLTVDALSDEDKGPCRDVNFDPLVLPDGIEASDDPVLSARSAAYAVSFNRRIGEPKTPSAVEVPADNKGVQP